MASRITPQDGDEYDGYRDERRPTSSRSQSAAKSKRNIPSATRQPSSVYSPPRSIPTPRAGPSTVQPRRADVLPSSATSPRQSQEAFIASSVYSQSPQNNAQGPRDPRLQQFQSGNGASVDHGTPNYNYERTEEPFHTSHQRRDSISTVDSRADSVFTSRSDSISTVRSDITIPSRSDSNDSMMRSQDLSKDVFRNRQTLLLRQLMDHGYSEQQAAAVVQERTRQSLEQMRIQPRQNDKSEETDEDEEEEESSEDESEDEVNDDNNDNDRKNTIRDRLPGPFKGRLAWKGEDLERGCEIIKLGSSDIESIRSAVKKCKPALARLGAISKKHFRLPTKLEKILREASEEIHRGRGFVTVRGLNKAGFDKLESTIAYVGVCAHVCQERAISRFSGLDLAMEHMYDARSVAQKVVDRELPPTKLPGVLRFHADRFNGDVLAMYVRHPGNENEGQQYICSWTTLYNELRRDAPQTLVTLGKPDWPFVKKTSIETAPERFAGPVIFWNGARVPICQLVLEPLLGEPLVQRPANEPGLSNEQTEAIRLVQQLASKHQYRLERREGDIQFINNLGNLHARAAYNQQGSGGRYLLRMFLRDPEYAWPRPPAPWAPYFDYPFPENSNGGLIEHEDLHPEIAVFLHG